MFNQITLEPVGKIHVVKFNANRIMDPITIEEIGAELQKTFDDHPGEKFLLDLRNVEFLSSAVLNRLIVLDKSAYSFESLFVSPEMSSIAQDSLSRITNQMTAV